MDKDIFESNVPLRILVGWAEGVSKNDASEIAKGFIQRRFDAIDVSWYATAPFMGGYFWEVHEAGKGNSYMPAIIDALTNDPGGQHWFPSGDRIFQVMMRDGKPFGVLLQKSESKAIYDSGLAPLRASGKMKPAAFKGTSVLCAGGGLLGAGAAFFLASVVMYAFAATPEPAVKDLNVLKTPSAQWEKLANTKPTEVVSKLEFEAGDWKIEKRPFDIKGLIKAEPPKPANSDAGNAIAAPAPTPAVALPPPSPAAVDAPAPGVVPPPPPPGVQTIQDGAPDPAIMTPEPQPITPPVPGVGVPDAAPAPSVPKTEAQPRVEEGIPLIDPPVDGAAMPPPVAPIAPAIAPKASKAPHQSKTKSSQSQKPVSSGVKQIGEGQRAKSAVMIDGGSMSESQKKKPSSEKRIGKPLSILPGDVK